MALQDLDAATEKKTGSAGTPEHHRPSSCFSVLVAALLNLSSNPEQVFGASPQGRDFWTGITLMLRLSFGGSETTGNSLSLKERRIDPVNAPSSMNTINTRLTMNSTKPRYNMYTNGIWIEGTM